MYTSPPASPFPHDQPPYDRPLYDRVVDRLRAAGCVFAEDEAELLLQEAGSATDLTSKLDRRVAGEPLEHILGWTEFCGLRILVRPGVFVPRQRTALMVDEAVAGVQARRLGPGRIVLLDLCCGAGAVGAAVHARLSNCEVFAGDIDPTAVACAQQNLPPDAHTFTGDLYAPLPPALQGRVDVLVANAPYVPTDALRVMPPEARLHEPPVALDGGHDGLQLLQRVIAEARQWLSPGGQLLIESGGEQAPRAADLMVRAGLLPRVAVSEDLGATVVIGSLRDR